MRATKLVFIGAGSLSFGGSMLRDIFSAPQLRGSLLSLVDTDEAALDRMYRAALGLNEASGMHMTIEKTTRRREALPGAEFIVSAIAIERCDLWKQDFAIPKKYGIRHTLGENGGPGALFFTMRTIPVVLDIARDIDALCPEALFMNFSNPESRIILALGRYARVRSVGLCHGIFMGKHQVADIMGVPYESIQVTGAGLNHFQWILDIREKATGRDLRPLLAEREKTFDPQYSHFCRKLYRAFGYFPSCSDDHVGEYLAYGWEAGEEGYDFAADGQNRVRTADDLEARIAGRKTWDDMLTSSGERAVDIAAAMLDHRGKLIESGVVYNRGAIPNLPDDAAVEVPIAVDGTGVHPVRVELPKPLARMLTPQVMVQQMSVDAAVHGDYDMALQALLMDPAVDSTDAAAGLLKELWEINKPYIRNCL